MGQQERKARILLLPLAARPADVVLRPEALVRAVLAAARHLPDGTQVVPVRLPPRANQDEELRAQAVVAAAHGAMHLFGRWSQPGTFGKME